MPIKSPFADRLDMLFQAGALVEHKDIADFLLFGASIPLCNRFVEETASFFGDFGFSIASRSRFRQKPDIAIAITIGSFSVSQVGQPIANGTRRCARIDLLLLVLVGFHQEIPLVSHLKGFISGLDEEPMNLRRKSHGGTLGDVLHKQLLFRLPLFKRGSILAEHEKVRGMQSLGRATGWP